MSHSFQALPLIYYLMVGKKFCSFCVNLPPRNIILLIFTDEVQLIIASLCGRTVWNIWSCFQMCSNIRSMLLSTVMPFWFWEITFLSKWVFRSAVPSSFSGYTAKKWKHLKLLVTKKDRKKTTTKMCHITMTFKQGWIEESSRMEKTVYLCRTASGFPELESMHIDLMKLVWKSLHQTTYSKGLSKQTPSAQRAQRGLQKL